MTTLAEHRIEEAVDPRVTRSRAAILEATAALLIEGGFDAIRHRAVAERVQGLGRGEEAVEDAHGERSQ